MQQHFPWNQHKLLFAWEKRAWLLFDDLLIDVVPLKALYIVGFLCFNQSECLFGQPDELLSNPYYTFVVNFLITHIIISINLKFFNHPKILSSHLEWFPHILLCPNKKHFPCWLCVPFSWIFFVVTLTHIRWIIQLAYHRHVISWIEFYVDSVIRLLEPMLRLLKTIVAQKILPITWKMKFAQNMRS